MIPFLQSILKLSTLPFGFITSTWIMFNGWRHLSTAKWSLQSCLIAAGLVLTPCSSTAWGLLAAKERTRHSLLILLTPVIIITQNCTKKKRCKWQNIFSMLLLFRSFQVKRLKTQSISIWRNRVPFKEMVPCFGEYTAAEQYIKTSMPMSCWLERMEVTRKQPARPFVWATMCK